MCCFTVYGLADTDLMVHIVASQMHILQILVRQPNHYDPSRDGGHQHSTDRTVRVLES